MWSSHLARRAAERCSRPPRFRRYESRRPVSPGDYSRKYIPRRFTIKLQISLNHLQQEEIDHVSQRQTSSSFRCVRAGRRHLRSTASPSWSESPPALSRRFTNSMITSSNPQRIAMNRGDVKSSGDGLARVRTVSEASTGEKVFHFGCYPSPTRFDLQRKIATRLAPSGSDSRKD